MKIFLFSLFFISTLQPVSAQLGSWTYLAARFDLTNKWSFTGETQLRSTSLYNNFHYYEFKGSLNYDITEKFTLGAMGGRYVTYNQGDNFLLPFQNQEWRTCLQVTLKQKVKRLRFEHRYRAEQRWTLNGYRNRFRNRILVSYPFAFKKGNEHKWTVTAWNELFLTNIAPYFERNRVFSGISYKLNDNLSFNAGYIYQFDYNLNDETGRDFLVLGIQLEFKRQNHEIPESGFGND